MHFGIANLVFALFLAAAVFVFARNVAKISRNIKLGKDIDRTDNKSQRWSEMIRVALGQSKMVRRPLAGFLHIIVYAGFVIINIEVLEILIDGILGTHRVFSFLGGFYDFLIGSFEILAFGVLVACIVFLTRRYISQIPRFWSKEMKGWPSKDATIILVVEIFLMLAFLKMNGADYVLQQRGVEHYIAAGAYPISSWMMAPILSSYSSEFLIVVERGAWWFHILGILAFLNYLVISKHFHIILAFPNVWYSNLKAKGRFTNMSEVTKEVKMMMDPNADPFAAPDPNAEVAAPSRFGAKDVTDLNWVQLMNAYSCTECGRCTSECPANQTGKELSPRKIMMDTRDRIDAVGKNIDANKGVFQEDGRTLLDDHISREELWACTSCNACVDACPINIDPLSIIVDMRRYLVMEESAAPSQLNAMMTNVENNGAPWAFSSADRLNWKDE